jgi:osmotically-inducible protein OsmY
MNTSTSPRRRTDRRALCLGLALAAAVTALSGCAPLIVGGAAMGGALMATDRRTSGTQVEDEGIEFKARQRIRSVAGDRSHVNITSYDREVLLTGEVFDAAAKTSIEQTVAQVENVRRVVNELEVMWPSTTADRLRDQVLATKIKATLVDAKDLSANAFTVVTERGAVYLMGKVTEAEASRAVELIRNISGVRKVVRVLQIITPEELERRTKG